MAISAGTILFVLITFLAVHECIVTDLILVGVIVSILYISIVLIGCEQFDWSIGIFFIVPSTITFHNNFSSVAI